MSAEAPSRVTDEQESFDEWSTIPHDCEPETVAPGVTRRVGSRLIGLDAARGLALVGMIAVHTISAQTEDGDMSLAWFLAGGKASALFAILGGVGIAFMSGRRTPPTGLASWWRSSLSPLVRGVLIVLLGLLLGSIIPTTDAYVILPYLGLMFIAAIALIPFRARTLLALGLTWAVVSPFLSHLLRQHLPEEGIVNLTVGHVVADPGQALVSLLLTGTFPALTWMSYLCIGMALGRADLGTRRVQAWIVAGGAALTVGAWIITTQLIALVGLLDRLGQDVEGHMPLDTFTELLVYGGTGTLPADSWWWLGVNAPHSGTPLDLLYTTGAAMLAIGLLLAASRAFGRWLRPLAIPGSMTLTLYTLHLLLLETFIGDWPEGWHFVTQIVVLFAFAYLWSRFLTRGPLEWSLWRATHLAVRAHPKAVREA